MAGPNSADKVFADLNSKAKVDLKSKTPAVICNYLNKIYDLGQKSTKLKDFDQAYIYWTRWLQCIEWLQERVLDKATINKYYPDSKVREVKNILNVIIESLKIKYEKQHQPKISNSTNAVTNRKSNINKDIDINFQLPEVPVDEPQPKEKTDISCNELFAIFNQANNEDAKKRILIIDVRSNEDFSLARISFKDNVIHIPEDAINDKNLPCVYRYVISNYNDKEAITRFNKKSAKHTDLIVLVDSNSTSSTMDSNSAIAKFKKCLEQNDQVTVYKKIAILKGGFEKWKNLYPSCVSTSIKSSTNLPNTPSSSDVSENFNFSPSTNKSLNASPIPNSSQLTINTDYHSPILPSKQPPGTPINLKPQTLSTNLNFSQPTNKNFDDSPVISNSQLTINTDFHSPILSSKHPPGKQINLKPQMPSANTTNSTVMIPSSNLNFANSAIMDYQVPSDPVSTITDIHSSVSSNQHPSGALKLQNSTGLMENSSSISPSNLESLYQKLPVEFNRSLMVPLVPTAPMVNGVHSSGSSDKQLLKANNMTREAKVIVNKMPIGRPDIDRSKKPGRSKSAAEAIVDLECSLLALRNNIKEYEAKKKNHLLTNWMCEELETMLKKEEEMIAELQQKKAAEVNLYPVLQNMNLPFGTRSREARQPKPNHISENKENIQEPRTIKIDPPLPVKIDTPPPIPEMATPPAQKIPAPTAPKPVIPLAQRMEVDVDDDDEEEIYKQPLKHESAPTNTGLKRSISSPNLTQVKKFKANDGQGKLKEERRIVPDVDRSTKPKEASEKTIKQVYSCLSSKDREQRMEPVYASSGSHPGITGLKNLGNSCYMNSIIQCLSNTECLAKYFTESQYVNDLNKNDKIMTNVAEEVAQVIKALWRGQYKSISPRDLKIIVGQSKLQFGSYDQQDSHEFLMFLLDWMHNDLKQKSKVSYSRELTTAEKEWEKSMNGQSSMISQLFFGQLRSTIECLSCHKTSETFETFNSLTMSLPDYNKCKLDDCVKKFVSGQNVSGWKCPNCKVPREGIKKFDIAKLPHIIVIHLNRFGDTRGWLEKKSTAVEFPLNNFNLKPYVVQDGESLNNANTYYNLYAMSNHYGTMDGGHYTAYCRSYAQNKWYKYDDHTVTEVTSHQVQNQSSSAYLLFYASAQAESFLNR